MDKMNDRRKAFENKFAHDSEMTFKAEARRNRMLAAWLGDKFGMSDEEAAAYGGTLIAADLKEAGDDDVVQKVLADASERGITIDEERAICQPRIAPPAGGLSLGVKSGRRSGTR